jgi:hypothetical protein
MQPPSDSDAPRLSVIVPSVNGWSDLERSLGALEAESRETPIEVIVIDRCGDVVRQSVRERFGCVRLLEVGPGVTIPAMRAVGMREAHGDAIAVIEDHVIVPRGWARQLLDGLAAGADVVGGTVENAATDSVMDWAAFLCEYSHCIAPLPAGPAEWLTGNNVAYRRQVLEKYRAVVDAGRWENYLHDALRRDGIALVCRPEISVWHRKHYTFAEYLTQRYYYARSYAGARTADSGRAKRLAYAVAALALPPVLLYRTVTRALSKRRHQRQLLLSLPLLSVFVVSWAAGEAVGYFAGPADSLAKVR